MKWLFILAALLNIAFFSYHGIYAGENGSTKSIARHTGKNQIVRLVELSPDQLNKLQQKTVFPKQSNRRLTESKAISDAEPLAKTEQQNVLPSGKSMVENDSAIITEAEDIAKIICYMLGPFSKNKMQEIRLILEKEYQNQLSFGIETTSTSTYYRIYIPPLENKAKIKETLAKLDKNGLKDHYVMSIDGRKNAIALGVFKKRSAAERVAVKADKAGYSTTIEAITDDKNSQYKLQLFFKENQDLTGFEELLKQKNLKSTECEK